MEPVHFSPLAQQVIPLLGLLCWSAVYALMVWRGIKDRSFGMPLTALCVNVVWETVFTFSDGTPPVFRAANGLWLVLDLAVLGTLLKFGRDDYAEPLLREIFYPLIAFVLLLAAVAVVSFRAAFQDIFGGISATLTTLLLSAQLPALLVRRNRVTGQSLYIGIFVLLGDLAGWAMNHIAKAASQPNIPILWVNAANVCIIACNLLYLALYWRVCRRDGVNPWRRL